MGTGLPSPRNLQYRALRVAWPAARVAWGPAAALLRPGVTRPQGGRVSPALDSPPALGVGLGTLQQLALALPRYHQQTELARHKVGLAPVALVQIREESDQHQRPPQSRVQALVVLQVFSVWRRLQGYLLHHDVLATDGQGHHAPYPDLTAAAGKAT